MTTPQWYALFLVLLLAPIISFVGINIQQTIGYHNVTGTVVAENSWTGQYGRVYNLTVAYQGEVIHAIVHCDLYHINSTFPISVYPPTSFLSGHVEWGHNGVNPLPSGCL